MKILGIEDRASWKLISRDNRFFKSETVIAKPDFVIQHVTKPHCIVPDYKSRFLGGFTPKSYELYQAVINAMTVKFGLEQAMGFKTQFTVVPALVYGDEQKFIIQYSQRDADNIAASAIELSTSERRISATKLAKMLSGEEFNYSCSSHRKRGLAAHHALAHAV
jgi:hypothetical protein